MSKVDALRALREAKYAARPAAARSAAPDAPSVRPSKVAAAGPGKVAAAGPGTVAASAATADLETCGHRNMSGRTCTRPAQHAEKNHRYVDR